MAFHLAAQGVIDNDLSIIEYVIPCFDTIGDPEFEYEHDYDLHNRSALELVRDQLTPAQRQELDKIDEFWRANPEKFNAAYGIVRIRSNRDTALRGYVKDEKGHTPEIPKDHWWWRPIED